MESYKYRLTFNCSHSIISNTKWPLMTIVCPSAVKYFLIKALRRPYERVSRVCDTFRLSSSSFDCQKFSASCLLGPTYLKKLESPFDNPHRVSNGLLYGVCMHRIGVQ